MAIETYETLIEKYPTEDKSRPASRARGGIVGVYLWRLQDFTTAETIAREHVAFTYPDDAYPGVYALAANRLGRTLQRKGWEARDNVGQDYVAYFNEAIYWLERASPAYYPGTLETEGYVLDAKRQKLDCLTGLKRYADSRSTANALLANVNFTASDKAWIALSMANSYREEISQYSADANFNAALALFPALETAVTMVSAYEKTPGVPVDNGRQYAEALLRYAEAVERFTERARWYNLSTWGPSIAARAANGIARLDLLCNPVSGVTATFSGLNVADWYFYDANRARGKILRNWGSVVSSKYDEAITAFQALADSFSTVGYSPRSRLVWLYQDLAYLYSNRGKLVDLYVVKDSNPGNQVAVDLAYGNAIADFEAAAQIYTMAADLVDETTSELIDPESQVNARIEAGYIRRQMLQLVRHYINCGGVFDQTDIDTLYTWYVEGVESLQAITENTGYLALDSGGIVQKAWNRLGSLHERAALVAKSLGSEASDLRPILEYSVAAYRMASDLTSFPGADVWSYSEARSNLVRQLIELASTYNSMYGDPVSETDRETATDLFDEAYTELAEILVDGEIEEDDQIWASQYLGNGVNRLWDLLTGILSGGEDMDDLEIRAELGIQILSIIPAQYAYFEEGEPAAGALFEIASLHENLAWEFESGGDLAEAISRWEDGKDILQQLLNTYGTNDWWMVNDAENRILQFQDEIDRLEALL